MGGIIRGDNGQGMPDWSSLGLPPPEAGVKEGTTISSVRELANLLGQDGLTKAEGEGLKSIVTIAISDPQLPAVDKQKLEGFLEKLDKALTTLKAGGDIKDPAVSKARNDWMVASAVCDLFSATNEIAMLISKMSRSESQLKQSLGVVMLSMAKTAMELTIQAGEARAQQYELEAQKCWLEMGMALGQIVVTAASIAASGLKEANEKAKMEADKGGALTYKEQLDIHNSVTSDTRALQEISSSTMTAIKSGIEAVINMKKADLERDAALADGVKQMLDKLYQLINDTYSMLGEDMKDQRQMLEKLLQTLESAQRTMAEQWKA